MPELDLTLDAVGAWPDLLHPPPTIAVWRRVGVYPPAETTPMVRIALVLELPDARRVFSYATWPELYRVLKAIEAHYGQPVEDTS
jgi:hypothetical protein